MEKTGFALGYDSSMDDRAMAYWMRQAEDRGYSVGFFSETIELMRDSVSALAAIGLQTEEMTVGCTQIVRLRTPLVMAQSVAALDELMDGRMMFAPGACTATHAKRHGLPPAHPATSLREYVESIRLILSGERVSYDGEFVNFHDVELGFSPRRTHVPMLLPATSRTGLVLAGQIADGVVLNAVCSPEYSENAIRIIRESAEAAGRDFSQFQITQLINCSVEDDHESAMDAIRWEVASKLDPIQLPFIVRAKQRVGEPFMSADDIPMFEEAWNRGGKEALIAVVPDSYIEGMTATGTPDEVMAMVKRYREAGVQVPILRPAAAHQAERLLDLFASA